MTSLEKLWRLQHYPKTLWGHKLRSMNHILEPSRHSMIWSLMGYFLSRIFCCIKFYDKYENYNLLLFQDQILERYKSLKNIFHKIPVRMLGNDVAGSTCQMLLGNGGTHHLLISIMLFSVVVFIHTIRSLLFRKYPLFHKTYLLPSWGLYLLRTLLQLLEPVGISILLLSSNLRCPSI